MSAVVTPTRRGPLAAVARAAERTYLRLAIALGERRLQRRALARCVPSVLRQLSGALELKRVRLALLEAV
jgi:hypothetical protein